MDERIRDFRPGEDDAPVAALWERVFGHARGGQTVEWLFRSGPAGESPRAVAEVDGRIVAHAGAAPIRFLVGSEEVRGAYSVGAMTDPAFQGRGLWARMGLHLYERLEREGFAFVAGFSNANSHRLMTGRLGRTPVRPFPWCVKLLSPLGLLRALARRGGSPEQMAAGPAIRREESGALVTEVPADDPRLDAVWKRAASTVPVGCVRDTAYAAWRFASRPDAGYRVLLVERAGEPAGYAVHRALALRGVRAGFLLDFLLAPGEAEASATLLRAAADLARGEGAVLLSALLPGTGPAREALRRGRFLRIPERLHPQLIRFSVRGLGRWAQSALLVSPTAWHLSWADTDVV